MTSIFLRDGAGVQTDDITSSAFPDYPHDLIWVGGALEDGFIRSPAPLSGHPPRCALAVSPFSSTRLTPRRCPVPSSIASPAISSWVTTADFSIASAPPPPSPSPHRSISAQVWLLAPSLTRPPGRFTFFPPAMAARPAPDLSLVPPCTSSPPISGHGPVVRKLGSEIASLPLPIPIRFSMAASTARIVLPSMPPATSTSAEIPADLRSCIRFQLLQA